MSGNKDYCSYSNKDADSICGEISTAPTEESKLPTAPPLEACGQNLLYPQIQVDQEQQHSAPVVFIRCFSCPVDDFEVVCRCDLPIHDNYLRQVSHIGAINYSKAKVMGMVLFSPFLYVIHKRPNVLCKYDTTNTSPSAFIVPPVSNQTIPGLDYPRGMAANHRTKSLFLTNRDKYVGMKSIGSVFKVSLDGVVLARETFDFEPFGVSVGAENERIIVACCKHSSPVSLPLMGSGHILIFEDVNDRLRLQLTIPLEESIEFPRHVVEAPIPAKNGHGKEYLVVHGWTKLPTVESHHRVVRVCSNGKVMRSFGTGHGSGERQLDRPVSLCLDDSDKMFVADSFNHRVLLLSRNPSENHDLELVRPLLTAANGLRRPRHVCPELSKRLLFVGQDSGRIDVFLVGNDAGQTRHT